MEGYIINPIWFYFIGVCEALKTIAYIFATTLIMIVASGFAMYSCGEFYDEDKALKKLKKMAIATVILFVVAIILPSEQTLITMMVAKFATYENTGFTVEAVKSVVDYIVEAIKSI